MENESIAESYTLSSGYFHVTSAQRFPFERVQSEGARPDVTISARHPVSWMPGIGGMVEDGDPNSLAVDLAPIVDPSRPFPPDRATIRSRSSISG
jgi:hypothetical protein